MGTDDGAEQSPAVRVETSRAFRQLIEDDAVGQLRRREGLMATLGSEDGVLKLDWVEGVARLLESDTKLEEIETEAREIWERGIRQIIWAGMGGSVIAVRVLTDLGFCSGHNGERIVIYPLDSTDPEALNEIVRKIAEAKDLTLPTGQIPSNPAFLHTLLDDVMMVGVSMGMTSEEPITHLTWFTDLLEQAQLRPAEHFLVMTLPGSYLDLFAREHQVPSHPLQLDRGTGTGGRMSAPTTRVFLLPAALHLTCISSEPGQLRKVLLHAWQEYNLALAAERPADHVFMQLAAALSDASTDGACRLLLRMPEGWQAFVPWVEQLMEESLGKGGKGVVVFDDQTLNRPAPGYRTSGAESHQASQPLQVCVVADSVQSEGDDAFILYQPYLASEEPRDRLAAVAASFLGWQLSMALYGYLHRITFSGQPAVENYKARARALRTKDDPLQVALNWGAATTDGSLMLLAPQEVEVQGSPAFVFARTLQQAVSSREQLVRLGYLDFTFNGEPSASIWSVIDTHLHAIGNELLGVPVKLRRAPAAYHSTEQSEMDGPPYLVSLRLFVRHHEESILGTYTDTFLRAQAVSTWQAMIEQGRPCFLLLIDGSVGEAGEPLKRFFQDVEGHLHRLLAT
jgi:hypothetical protein